jgi:hypothetical protein
LLDFVKKSAASLYPALFRDGWLIPVALMLICGQAPQSPTRTVDVHRAVRFSLSRSDLFHIICLLPASLLKAGFFP